MVTTMAFLQYYLKSSTKRGWEMSSLLVAIQMEGLPNLDISQVKLYMEEKIWGTHRLYCLRELTGVGAPATQ